MIDIEEEFLDYVTDGSLAIEVYGNRSRGFDQKPSPIITPTENEGEKSMVDRFVFLLLFVLFGFTLWWLYYC